MTTFKSICFGALAGLYICVVAVFITWIALVVFDGLTLIVESVY